MVYGNLVGSYFCPCFTHSDKNQIYSLLCRTAVLRVGIGELVKLEGVGLGNLR